jgi:hypothetical protein
MELIQELIDDRYGEGVLDGDRVQGPIVDTKLP